MVCDEVVRGDVGNVLLGWGLFFSVMIYGGEIRGERGKFYIFFTDI